MTVLITGGCGYIGSHTAVELLNSGRKVIILDNLSNSNRSTIARIQRICSSAPLFFEGDIRDHLLLRKIFIEHSVSSVIHFAGLKSVADGQSMPVHYYSNNVIGSLTLLEEMATAGIKSFVFSSSATVYGEPHFLPYTESHPLGPINVYGRTKLAVEQILQDLYASDPSWRIVILRYFNPAGAHSSGLIGEDPLGAPNNLMPFLAQVAVRRRDYLSIYGNDYDTEDGTGKRDYIHVDDLASGHMAALEYLDKKSSLLIANLGTGISTSVLELVRAFEVASKRAIPLKIVDRRNGDLPEYYADPQYAMNILGWAARHDIGRMCADSWRWQSMNPNGYD